MAKIGLLYCIDSVESDAGPDKQLAEMIRRIDQDRFDVHLCCFRTGPRLDELRAYCTPLVLPLGSIWRPNGLRQVRRLRRYINDRGIDVVHTWLVKANILGILAARRSRARAVLSSRRNLGYWMTPFYRWLYRRLNRWTTRLVANSERVKQFVIETERVLPDRVDVLYNGVDMAKYAPDAGDASALRALGVPQDARVVGIVANLRPVKDHALFLRAAKIVSDQVPRAAFVLVGTGPLRGELGRLADDLGIADRVFFSDGAGEVPDYLAGMSVGCLSSETEGFSNAILEYMAAGLPVAATDVGGNGEAVRDGVNGYLVPHGDPARLARPIIDLLTDEAKREQMGRASLDRCREWFDLDTAVRRYEEYYESFVETDAR
ncbi:MAG: glycosyltransferase [Planctomycetota bacterium]